MKFKEIILIGLVPVLTMLYGLYFILQRQSANDFSALGGIIFVLTGLVGLVVAFIAHLFIRKYEWHTRGYVSVLTGIISTVIGFLLIIVYSRLHI